MATPNECVLPMRVSLESLLGSVDLIEDGKEPQVQEDITLRDSGSGAPAYTATGLQG